MKKRFLSIVSVMLVASMMAATVTGCGSRTKATDITIDDGDTIIVDEEDLETEKDTEVESDTDDITDTEVIGGDAEETEEANTSVGAEDENIVLYDEIAEYGEYSVDMFDYVEQPGTVNATEDILIYNEEGIEVGYIKAGSSISISEGADVGGWSRFENPIADTKYDYLYVKKKFVTDPEEIQLNAETMKQGIIKHINEYVYDADYNFVDEKTSDMEVFECNMESRYQDQMMFNYWIEESIFRASDVIQYETLYIECEDDTDGWITCRIYYKDLIEDEN